MKLHQLRSHPAFLPRVLRLDALTSAAMGLLLVGAAPVLAGLLGLPSTLLRGAGLALFPFAAFVLWSAREGATRAWAVRCVVALNLVWVVESAWLLLGGRATPTALGVAFVTVQAAAVGAFAALEVLGLNAGRATRGTA